MSLFDCFNMCLGCLTKPKVDKGELLTGGRLSLEAARAAAAAAKAAKRQELNKENPLISALTEDYCPVIGEFLEAEGKVVRTFDGKLAIDLDKASEEVKTSLNNAVQDALAKGSKVLS